MIVRTFSILILTALLGGGCLSRAKENATHEVLRDLPFLEPSREEKLDLYLPKDEGGDNFRPAVVYIHGGGFTGGDKAQKGVVSNCRRLVGEGFVVASINYALVKEGPIWPQPLLDAKNGVRFLRANAAKYRVDPKRIAVMGSSAGGQLALLTALTPDLEYLEPNSPWPGVSSAVNAAVNFFGGTNYITRKESDEEGRPTEKSRYAEKPPALVGQNRALWVEASPVTHVKKDSPPIFTAHGKKDLIVNYLQAVELAEVLDKAGVPNKLVLLENAPHSFTFDRQKGGKLETDLLPAVSAFLREAPPSE